MGIPSNDDVLLRSGGGMLFADKRVRQREPVEEKWSKLEERGKQADVRSL